MSTLICGSMAYDTIMVFRDQFKNHILPDQLHILNVAFLVPDMRREFGGCAGNIAYTLKMLGGEARIMATVGDDFAPYDERLQRLNLAQDYIRMVPGTFTAQAFITTDLDDNQITAFHPGAMNHAHENHVSDAKGVTLGIVAPDGRDGMIQHAKEFNQVKATMTIEHARKQTGLSEDIVRNIYKLDDQALGLARSPGGWS
jgi:adenosine kinase